MVARSSLQTGADYNVPIQLGAMILVRYESGGLVGGGKCCAEAFHASDVEEPAGVIRDEQRIEPVLFVPNNSPGQGVLAHADGSPTPPDWISKPW